MKDVIMIDTIVLTIPEHQFEVTGHCRFKLNSGGLFYEPYMPFSNEPYIKCVQNMSKDDIKQGNYKPRLTLYKRMTRISGQFNINLHIEFSVPKLLYGNNFDELRDEDFTVVIDILRSKLSDMGVCISRDSLMNADVKTIHYGKNVVFNDHTTASLIIGYLGKIKLTKRLDINKTEYRNEGHLVRYHSKSYSLVFYDKIADLKKSKDRACEKVDRNFNYEADTFDALRKKNPFEVLRMELRLVGKRTIKTHFKRYHIDSDFTFVDMFSKQKAQKILMYYWKNIIDEMRPVILQDLTQTEQFELIVIQRPNFTVCRVLNMVAVANMMTDSSHRKVRAIFETHFSKRSLDRIDKDLKCLDYKVLNRMQPITHVEHALKAFQPLTMHDIAPIHF